MEATEHKAKVLFVDDERRVLTSMRAMFRRKYNVFLANSGAEAVELLDNEAVDVIVSDQRMPGMTGVEVLKTFKERAPDAMRILLTGYADQDAITASINEGEVFRYLTKPCPREMLEETISLAVTAARGSRAPVADAPTAPGETAVAAARTASTPSTPSVTATTGAPRATGASVPTKPAPPPAVQLNHADVELLVLSSDGALIGALGQALEDSHVIHAVQSVDEAAAVLEAHAVGVFITDIAVNADEVQALTAQLKQHAPELVTIVASDHSDAHRLIELINGGQVFRFLLKPIKPKQTSIWIESAVSKHIELMKNPELLARHVVVEDAPTSVIRKFSDQVMGIASRLMRLRGRSAQPNQV